MKENKEKNIVMNQGFVGDIRSIIDEARATAVRSVDFSRVQMYWNIGRRIFEEEQQGKERADYGTYLIKKLAAKIEPEYGSGFGIRQLERARLFYRVYPIASTVRTQLNWSQYKLLISIDEFLLETGKGFSFVARQKRLLLEDDEFFADLVFYNRLLRCFVVVKTGKMPHQDLGQLQMYVNYYDRCEKQDDENPTIGILLCSDKNDTVVRVALHENNTTILASKYQLYLPTTEQLVKEIDQVKQSAKAAKEQLGEK